MIDISTHNNFISVLDDIFSKDKSLISFLDIISPEKLFVQGIDVKDNIHLRLFVFQLLQQRKISLWGLLDVMKQIHQEILQIPISKRAPYRVFLAYLDQLIAFCSSLVSYNGYQKLIQTFQGHLPTEENLQAVFCLDTTSIPYDSLCGISSFSNPIFHVILQEQPDSLFQLYDLMVQEAFSEKEAIVQQCSSYFSNIDVETFLEFDAMIEQMKTMSSPFSQFYIYWYTNASKKIFQNYQKQKRNAKKRSRTIMTSHDEYEYLGSIMD